MGLLLIEDDPHAARLLQLILRLYDIDVLIGENGRRGIQIAETEAPDLILLDLMLPDLGGL